MPKHLTFGISAMETKENYCLKMRTTRLIGYDKSEKIV
jgi:hypothetical protein